MSPLRVAAIGSLSVVTLFLVQAVGCGTKAVGIEDCREIESARCEAAAHCPDQIPIEDVDACKRFYRSHCQHGLAVDDAPSSRDVKACIEAIEAAGACAAEDPDTPIVECGNDTSLAEGHLADEITSVCDVIDLPQHTTACWFLNNTEDEPPTASEGGSGTNPFTGAGTAGVSSSTGGVDGEVATAGGGGVPSSAGSAGEAGGAER